MKVRPYVVFGLTHPELDTLVLNQHERATLRAAAAILDKVRTTRTERVPTDWYAGDDDDADLVFGRRICDDLSTTGRIDAPTVSSG